MWEETHDSCRLGYVGAGEPASGVTGRALEAEVVLCERSDSSMSGLVPLLASQPSVASSARGLEGVPESDGDGRGKDALSGEGS